MHHCSYRIILCTASFTHIMTTMTELFVHKWEYTCIDRFHGMKQMINGNETFPVWCVSWDASTLISTNECIMSQCPGGMMFILPLNPPILWFGVSELLPSQVSLVIAQEREDGQNYDIFLVESISSSMFSTVNIIMLISWSMVTIADYTSASGSQDLPSKQFQLKRCSGGRLVDRI